MATATHYSTLREGREHFSDLLDAAVDGRPASVTRSGHTVAAVDVERLRYFLARLQPSNAQIVPEADGWSVFIPGSPIAADGADLDGALEEAVLALRDYAEAWSERLHSASNHSEHWGLVQIVDYSTDSQLKAWLRGQ